MQLNMNKVYVPQSPITYKMSEMNTKDQDATGTTSFGKLLAKVLETGGKAKL